MSYQKFTVDNVVCARRFHITYDDAAKPAPNVQLDCPFCGFTVFSATNHPPCKLARQENLIQSGTLSDRLVRECRMTDHLSAETRHEPEKLIYKAPAEE